MPTDSLCRYYTDSDISRLLVSSFTARSVKRIVDIGVGDGALASAALERWNSAFLISADIEKEKKKIIETNPSQIIFHHLNGLEDNLENKLRISVGDIDIAVCNPPYGRLTRNVTYNKILNDAGFTNSAIKGRLTSEILFLAQNLRLLRNNGEIGIILPDTLMSGSDYRYFRKDILALTKVLEVIQLPEKVFSKETEAITHILILRKTKVISKYLIPLKLANKKGEITKKIIIPSSRVEDRIDFGHYYCKQPIILRGNTLEELGANVFRGKYSKKELIDLLGLKEFFHLSDFSINQTNFSEFSFRGKKLVNRWAQRGDILLSRVGKRTLGKVGFVKSGRIEISDCVIVIRLPRSHQSSAYNFLKSPEGYRWIQAFSKGVCSRFITKKDVLTMRIPISESGTLV
jgi:tRNA1(Val) A37 N6-methylase TrmN6